MEKHKGYEAGLPHGSGMLCASWTEVCGPKAQVGGVLNRTLLWVLHASVTGSCFVTWGRRVFVYQASIWGASTEP